MLILHEVLYVDMTKKNFRNFNPFVFANICVRPCLWGVNLMTEENNLTIEHGLYNGFVK